MQAPRRRKNKGNKGVEKRDQPASAAPPKKDPVRRVKTLKSTGVSTGAGATRKRGRDAPRKPKSTSLEQYFGKSFCKQFGIVSGEENKTTENVAESGHTQQRQQQQPSDTKSVWSALGLTRKRRKRVNTAGAEEEDGDHVPESLASTATSLRCLDIAASSNVTHHLASIRKLADTLRAMYSNTSGACRGGGLVIIQGGVGHGKSYVLEHALRKLNSEPVQADSKRRETWVPYYPDLFDTSAQVGAELRDAIVRSDRSNSVRTIVVIDHIEEIMTANRRACVDALRHAFVPKKKSRSRRSRASAAGAGVSTDPRSVARHMTQGVHKNPVVLMCTNPYSAGISSLTSKIAGSDTALVKLSPPTRIETQRIAETVLRRRPEVPDENAVQGIIQHPLLFSQYGDANTINLTRYLSFIETRLLDTRTAFPGVRLSAYRVGAEHSDQQTESSPPEKSSQGGFPTMTLSMPISLKNRGKSARTIHNDYRDKMSEMNVRPDVLAPPTKGQSIFDALNAVFEPYKIPTQTRAVRTPVATHPAYRHDWCAVGFENDEFPVYRDAARQLNASMETARTADMKRAKEYGVGEIPRMDAVSRKCVDVTKVLQILDACGDTRDPLYVGWINFFSCYIESTIMQQSDNPRIAHRSATVAEFYSDVCSLYSDTDVMDAFFHDYYSPNRLAVHGTGSMRDADSDESASTSYATYLRVLGMASSILDRPSMLRRGPKYQRNLWKWTIPYQADSAKLRALRACKVAPQHAREIGYLLNMSNTAQMMVVDEEDQQAVQEREQYSLTRLIGRFVTVATVDGKEYRVSKWIYQDFAKRYLAKGETAKGTDCMSTALETLQTWNAKIDT